jgi:hypothetical protein
MARLRCTRGWPPIAAIQNYAMLSRDIRESLTIIKVGVRTSLEFVLPGEHNTVVES